MEPKYGIGQKVKVKSDRNQSSSARDADIGYLSGQTGTVANYYWISPIGREVFYIYTVQFAAGQKGIVLYEDEIEAVTARASKKSVPPS